MVLQLPAVLGPQAGQGAVQLYTPLVKQSSTRQKANVKHVPPVGWKTGAGGPILTWRPAEVRRVTFGAFGHFVPPCPTIGRKTYPDPPPWAVSSDG